MSAGAHIAVLKLDHGTDELKQRKRERRLEGEPRPLLFRLVAEIAV